ncbi:MAG TPA: nicotinate (nicotinamide) nucleotide adenylyltransferase [Acidobacteriota bacterium]|nr:nicotinate (nicotinamide) nucleotide adenylyltransferase [Acidobacteriota bacterium]
MRVGILGGTFDPFHEGHHKLGLAMLDRLGLDQVWLMVAGEPPHKVARSLTSPWHRFAMAVLGTESDMGLFVSTLELEREGPSFTADTMSELSSRFPHRFCFIAGADALREIHLWKDCARLFYEYCLVFVAREGVQIDLGKLPVSEIAGIRPEPIRPGRKPPLEAGRTYIVNDWTPPPVSSTLVRELLSEGKDPGRSQLDVRVYQYIRKYHLYERESAVGDSTQSLSDC